jgi:hypothetical protein
MVLDVSDGKIILKRRPEQGHGRRQHGDETGYSGSARSLGEPLADGTFPPE